MKVKVYRLHIWNADGQKVAMYQARQIEKVDSAELRVRKNKMWPVGRILRTTAHVNAKTGR